MNKYKYVATDKNGKKIKGTFVAESETEMKEMLLKAGYFVTSSRQVSSTDLSSFFSISGKVKVKELSQFCNQFAVMISAGISIVEAVSISCEQTYGAKLKSTLKQVKEDLREGVLLSEAMAKHPKVFPSFFTAMIYVGESTGCLDQVLVTVAEYYELEEKTKKKVKSALMYPIILLVLLIGVVLIMLLFVIPTFITNFTRMGIEMPALTMAVFNMSVFFQENWIPILGLTLATIIILYFIKFLPSVGVFYDKLKVTLPIMKKINLAIFTSRFCRSLGLLLSSGADTLNALESLRKTITNKFLYKQFDKVVDDVRMGMALSSALTAEMKVSPILIQMIIVGERTGELDRVLIKTSPYFDREAENSLTAITTIIQPAMMVILAVVIAILFVAIYSPILQMVQSLDTGGI